MILTIMLERMSHCQHLSVSLIVCFYLMSPLDYGDNQPVGERTRDRIDTLKDEANED